MPRLKHYKVRLGCRVEVFSGSGPGVPERWTGRVVTGPDTVGNWYVCWDGSDEDHEPYGGRYGWEGLGPDNVIGGEVSIYKDPPLHKSEAKERSMHFKFVIEIDTKNAGAIKDETYDAVATMLFDMIKPPEAPWIIKAEVYDYYQVVGQDDGLTSKETNAPSEAGEAEGG